MESEKRVNASLKYSYLEQTFGWEDDKGNSVTWAVKDIIEHVSGIEPVRTRVDLFKGFLDYKEEVFDREDWQRVDSANLKYPILLGAGTFLFNPKGHHERYPYIFDGVHRLVKARKKGKEFISAIVTSTLPPPVVTGKGMQLNGVTYHM